MSDNQPAEGVAKLLDKIAGKVPVAVEDPFRGMLDSDEEERDRLMRESYSDGWHKCLQAIESALQGHEIVKEGLVKAYEGLIELLAEKPPEHAIDLESSRWDGRVDALRARIAQLKAPNA